MHHLYDGTVLGSKKEALAAWAEMKGAGPPVQAGHTCTFTSGPADQQTIPGSALRTSRLRGEARFLPGLTLEPSERSLACFQITRAITVGESSPVIQIP